MKKEIKSLSEKLTDLTGHDMAYAKDIKEYINDVMDTLHFTKEERAWMRKRAGPKLISKS